MKEHGILFTAPMVRALLAGTKTQTRRFAKPQGPSDEAVRSKSGTGYHYFTDHRSPGIFRAVGPVWAVRELGGPCELKPPHGPVGRRLWVKETWHQCPHCDRIVAYRGGGWKCDDEINGDDDRPLSPKCAAHKWRSAMLMPRWASRITLEVTRVRLERVHEITEEDARAEGVQADDIGKVGVPCYSARQNYRTLWDIINGAGSWASNPWVWVYDFRRVTP